MILIDCPSCDGSFPVDLPLAATVRCDGCSTTWDVMDAAPAEVLLAA